MEQVNIEHLKELTALRAQLAEAQAELAAAELDAGRLTLLNMALERKIEKAQREATDQHTLYLHPPKQASTEQPVGVIMNNTFLPTMSMDDLRPGNVYYTPPTATALVEDFKRRCIEVCSAESELAEELGYERFHRYAAEMKRKIESLPLIGEK